MTDEQRYGTMTMERVDEVELPLRQRVVEDCLEPATAEPHVQNAEAVDYLRRMIEEATTESRKPRPTTVERARRAREFLYNLD